MKRYSLIKSLILIFALLISQLGNAFVLAPQMQACGMDMSSSAQQAQHQSMTDMAESMMQEHSAMATGSMSSVMDCCDQAPSLTCCESDCQCSSIIAASFFVSNNSTNAPTKSSAKTLVTYSNHPLAPFLHQPKRPPITQYS